MSKFHELIHSGKPVLVDFFAEWCGPCKAMGPELLKVSEKLGEKVKVIKVDVDKNPQAANTYRIQGVPTLILFKNGEIKWRQSGMMTATQLEGIIKLHI